MRGFSFSDPEASLDMRLDPSTQGIKASDLLNALREDQLTDLFETTMEKGAAGWLARRVLDKRPIATVENFLEACQGLRGKPGLNSATLPFLALRIAVNSELDNLRVVLPKAYELLEEGGKLIVISFHSGEDRVVKNFISGMLVKPSEEEIEKNPRARSAKMRVITKT
jgi:16S rRNA (cytosine1402-N4)-methyltransferase